MRHGTANVSELHSWFRGRHVGHKRGAVARVRRAREHLAAFHIDFMSDCALGAQLGHPWILREGSQGLFPVHLCVAQYLAYMCVE